MSDGAGDSHPCGSGVQVQFDYFFTMFDPARRPYHDVLRDAAEQVVLAEELGFTTAWAGEHHFGGEGYDIQPNPIMTHLYLAARTSHIRLGLAAVILPEWHPLRLAEDIAILDHVSGGRVECGVGRGITNREISNLNDRQVDRRFPEANLEIFLETLAILRRAWTTDPLVWSGKYYKFPRPGVTDSYAAWYPRNPGWRAEDGEYVGMSVVPKPLQSPHPPLWNVGDSDSSFVIAAEQNLKQITWLRASGALAPAFERYRQIASRIRGRQLRLGEDCAVMRVCFVAPTEAKARERSEAAIERLFRDYIGGLRSRQIYAEPGEQLTDHDEDKPWFDFLNERGHLLVGTPDTVSQRIAEMQANAGVERLLIFTWLPLLSQEEIISSLKLFGREVIPAFSGSSGRSEEKEQGTP